MPLVKQGRIATDIFVHVADGAELPGEGAILVSAARFLDDPEALLHRGGKLGVIWPNNRNLDDLLPYLDRLGVVALVFPTFRDGRAYSQARLLRERYGYDGELRATGQVLRDQFVFMLRAGFDALEVKKQADAEAFAETVKRYTVFYQPTGDGRDTALNRRMQLRAFGECRTVSTLAPEMSVEATVGLPTAEALDRALRSASPAEVIEAALKTVGREQLALVSSFGTESAALLKVMADVDPAIPVIFLDTGWLFEETLAYRDTLIDVLGLRDVRSIKPLEETLSARGSRAGSLVLRSRRLLPDPQSGAAGARAKTVLGLDQWAQAFSGRRPRRDSRGRGRRYQAEIQSVRQCLARGDRGDLRSWQSCRRIRWSPPGSCRSAACPAPAAAHRTKTPAPGAGAARPRQNAAFIRSRLRRIMTLPRRKH